MAEILPIWRKTLHNQSINQKTFLGGGLKELCKSKERMYTGQKKLSEKTDHYKEPIDTARKSCGSYVLSHILLINMQVWRRYDQLYSKYKSINIKTDFAWNQAGQ